MSMIQLIVVQDELSPLTPPIRGIEEYIHTLLSPVANSHWRRADWCTVSKIHDGQRRATIRVAGVLLQPLPQHAVPAPVSRSEFDGGELLVKVARVLVEDCEERLCRICQ